ncbi:methyltransferase domain-containing protein [Herbaspirillum sp. HC18]|nr:methyltransferase domain-containing protein [Herbaspirillum sp. HC18]
MGWDDGYVSDINYTVDFIPEQSPACLSLACVLNGFEPVSVDQPFNYLELGSGRGFTANILAASNPQGTFHAVDFLPSHVVEARQLATAAGLENISYLENSFAELAEGKVPDLPQFDFVTMHGVYSWVSPENRRHIRDILARYLKPGGIVYLSYNAMPGWTPMLPLQKLMREHAGAYPGRSDVQVRDAQQFIEKLFELRALHFSKHKALKAAFDATMDSDSHYLAHEYMNQHWEPLHFADVARDLAIAKLDFAGSATLAKAFEHLYLSSEQREMLSAIPNEMLRETAKDCLINASFRRDVFIRGARRMSSRRQREWLWRMGIALIARRETITLDFKHPLGALKGREDLYAPMLDALEERPHTVGELAALPSLRNETLENIVEAATLLIDTEKAGIYCANAMERDPGPAHRLNQAIALGSAYECTHMALASPLLGSGAWASLVQRLVYSAICGQSGDVNASAVIEHVRRCLEAQNDRLTTETESTEAEQAVIEKTVNGVLALRLPIWRHLRVI